MPYFESEAQHAERLGGSAGKAEAVVTLNTEKNTPEATEAQRVSNIISIGEDEALAMVMVGADGHINRYVRTQNGSLMLL